MKRELKPFVVEVKRGKRRQSFLGQFEDKTATMNEATRRAELALFAGHGGSSGASKPRASEAAGRILPSLIEPAPVEVIMDEEPAPRRRGRKPGSKNKPKAPSPDHRADVGEPASQTVSVAPPGEEAPGSWFEAQEPPKPLPVEPPEAQRAEPTAAADGRPRSRLRDRSLILARYVHGTAPAPGEGSTRWSRQDRRSSWRRYSE